MRKVFLAATLASFAVYGAVPGFERFYRTGSDPVEGGLLLLAELGCVNCHPSSAGLDARTGPVLTGAGSRLRTAYVDRVLAGQAAPTMPHFPALSPSQRSALTALLASSQASPLRGASGAADRGRALFARTGCAACHGLTVPNADGKYQPGALAAFLRDPLSIRPSGRMPRFPLDDQQAADLEAYLSQETPAPPRPAAGAAGGREIFASAGCANCHRLVIGGEAIASTLGAPSIESVANHMDQGCLGPASHTTPRYSLDAREREAVRAAIRALAGGHRPTDAQRLELRLAALNCYACHARNAKGGPEAAKLEFFTVLEDTDLGDEGRLPPPLTAAGYKLTAAALRDAIAGKTHVHPQMATRMPDFGAAHAAQLARDFEKADMPAGFRPSERTGRNAAGRELVGIKGLGCVNCHNLRGRKSLGIGASDLALAPRRLRVEWFRDFLLEPSRFHPATRMPSFWPGGVATNQKISRGNPAAQIDSIWVYLMEVDQTRLPAGLEEKGAFELKPTDQAIVLRAFMKDAGTHAVAVGFPQQVHAAFDSNHVRWALLWRGRFVDAESVWEDRFNPPMSPLGTDVLILPPGSSFAKPGDPAAAWPADGPLPRFRGYRLDGAGAPSFLYDFEGAHIADTLRPAEGATFVRTVEVDSPARLWFRAAGGKSVEEREGWFIVDGRLRVRVADLTAVPRSGNVVVTLPPGRHTLRVELAW